MGAMIYENDPMLSREASRMGTRASSILVVDDEKSLLAMVRDVLEDEGYNVFTATGGHQAVELARRMRPDLIITDLMMPKMNGRLLRRILSSTPTTSNIPIILMTAAYCRQPEDRFAAVIAKPFEIDELLDDVQRCASCAHDKLLSPEHATVS